MVSKYKLDYADLRYSRRSMHRPMVTLLRPCMPGESFKATVRAKIESVEIANLRSPAILTHYFFFVPFRLLWGSWEAFITDPDSAITIPTVNNAVAPYPYTFEDNGLITTSWPRRALKAIWNSHFGDSNYTYADECNFVGDVESDANLAVPRFRAVSKMLAMAALDTERPADNFTGTVAGAVATIELNDLKRRLKANSRLVESRIAGTKYTDTLLRYGVNVGDALINRPEMIKMSSQVIWPGETRVTSEVNTGTRSGRYSAMISEVTKKVTTPEHGVLIAFAGLRPILSRGADFFLGNGRESYVETSDQDWRDTDIRTIGGSADVEPDPLMPTYHRYHSGDVCTSGAVTGVLTPADRSTMAKLMYPTVLGDPQVDIISQSSVQGTTTVPSRARP